MRFVARAVVCAGVLLAVAGCNSVTDQNYFDSGIGTELKPASMVQTTNDLESYVNAICFQAGLSRNGEDCGTGSNGKSQTIWKQFVETGMNDIDRRCDAYLSWLDARRRDREPILRELAAAGAATHSIMTVAGSTNKALEIASAAFGLAIASYGNWNSRLLLEVSKSTVQTIVYTRQTDFRNAIKDEKISDRARAIYLLRNYIRICLPITIETDINTSIILVQRGDPNAVKEKPVVQPAGLGKPLDPEEKAGTRHRKPGRPIEEYKAIIHSSANAAAFTRSVVINIQKAVCVPESEWGKIGETTRARIEIWQRTNTEFGKPNGRGKLTDIERKALADTQPCPTNKGVLNYFEWRTMLNATGERRPLTSLVNLLNKAPKDTNPDERTRLKNDGILNPDDAKFDDVRQRIAQVRRDVFKDKLFIALPDSMLNQATDDLQTALYNLPPKGPTPAASPAASPATPTPPTPPTQPVSPPGGR